MIGVITNPYARGVAIDSTLPGRLARIGGSRTVVHETRNPKELSTAVREFADSGVEVIAACGGDGTNLSVLTEMIHVYGADRLPRFAILRGGTVNTVATNFGIKGSPEQILTRLVACHNRGMLEAVEERPLLRVNDSYGFLFGAAMGARFFEAYYGGPGPGLAWASVLAARLVSSSLVDGQFARRIFEQVPARVTVDGQPLPNERWTLLVAATVPNVGLQVRITYRAMERQGAFHLVASGLPPFVLARQFHRTFLSRPLTGQPHFDLVSSETTMEFDRPEPYIMDGDIFRATRVVLARGPQVKLSIP